ncbi:cold-shock protein [Cryptosporangium sp. NPDC051539]|uniref:cold-shock protein n=1 Tax=Cryptosporangium sp. NPDC051539 TaxID=3363962 RepID=UPI003795445A
MTSLQGTVRHFAPDSRDGSVLLDDGSDVGFDAAAFDAGGLRLLRPGQRVRLERNATGDVVAVTIVTFPS